MTDWHSFLLGVTTILGIGFFTMLIQKDETPRPLPNTFVSTTDLLRQIKIRKLEMERAVDDAWERNTY